MKAPTTTETSTLSLHDALPISAVARRVSGSVLVPTSSSAALTPSGTIARAWAADRKSTRLNSSHITSSYAVFCLKKKKDQLLTGHAARCNHTYTSCSKRD